MKTEHPTGVMIGERAAINVDLVATVFSGASPVGWGAEELLLHSWDAGKRPARADWTTAATCRINQCWSALASCRWCRIRWEFPNACRGVGVGEHAGCLT